jgi:alkanesulfonate monooxygenase SsuD/methylene tetrahydromethanopterin reductase-like flavin-dependent oxidoreductase (luciferase family)
MGIGVLCFSTASPSTIAPMIEKYKTEIEKAEPVGGYVNNNVMVTSQMLCLEDGQRARDIAKDITLGYHSTLVFRYLDTFPKPPGIPDWPETLPEPTQESLDAGIAKGVLTIGTPEECIKTVERYRGIGADQLTFGMLSSTMPIEVAVEAVETFGRHVIPEFDKDPVHSTTRQRDEQLARIPA